MCCTSRAGRQSTKLGRHQHVVSSHSLPALQGWRVKRLYYRRHQHAELEKLGVQHTPDWDTFLKSCDVVSCLPSFGICCFDACSHMVGTFLARCKSLTLQLPTAAHAMLLHNYKSGQATLTSWKCYVCQHLSARLAKFTNTCLPGRLTQSGVLLEPHKCLQPSCCSGRLLADISAMRKVRHRLRLAA